MPVFRIVAAALISLLPLGAIPAAAAALNITIAGTFDGRLGGTDFTGRSLTFTGITDSDVPDEVYGEYQYQLSSLSVLLEGISYDVTEPTMAFVAPLYSLAGLVDADATRGLVRFDFSGGNSFYTDAQTEGFATTGGTLFLTAGSSIVSTGLPTPGAVPEPGTWLLLLVGFAAVGGALRRRSVRNTPAPLHQH